MTRASRSRYLAVAAGLAVLGVSLAGLTGCGGRQTPLSQLTPVQVWERGIEAYNANRWEDAIRYFDRFALVGGADPRVHQARFYSAEAHFNRREYITAAGRFTAIAGDLGRTDLAASARFMACRSYQELSPSPQRDQEYSRAAIEHCQALIDFFPDHHRVEEAREVVDEMWHKLAAKDFGRGEWYFNRRAYDSAITYYEDVVRLFPQTHYAPRALRRLMDVYDILDYQEEKEEARQRLQRNYPESPEARAVAGR